MGKRAVFLQLILLQTALLIASGPNLFASETARLLETMTDARSDARAAAARALGRYGDPEAVDPLVNALGDPVDDVRDAAAASLRELGEPLGKLIHTSLAGWGKEWEARAEKARKELAARKDPRTFSPVARALGAWSVDVRVAAAKTLQALGDPRAVEPLIQAMGSEYRLVRAAAASALYEVGDGRAVDPLIAALKDGYDPVRVAAAGTLGKLGDRRAVEPLVAASGDWYNGVRAAAMRSLGYFGGPRVAESLITGLRDPHANVRVEAVRALGKLRDPRASGPLIFALVDYDPSVRTAATLALDAMGEPVGRLLIEALAGIPEARRDLVKRKDPRVVDPLIHALRNPDAKVRRSAARILGDIGDPRAIDGLVGMAGGWNPADLSVATFALSQLDDDGTGRHSAALRVVFAPATIALSLGFCAAAILLLYGKRIVPKAFRRKTAHRRPPRYDWPGWK